MGERHVISHTTMNIAAPDKSTLYKASFVIGLGLTFGIAFGVSILVAIRKALELAFGA